MDGESHNFPSTLKGSVYNDQQHWHGDDGRFISKKLAMEMIGHYMGFTSSIDENEPQFTEVQETEPELMANDEEVIAPQTSKVMSGLIAVLITPAKVTTEQNSGDVKQLELLDDNNKPLYAIEPLGSKPAHKDESVDELEKPEGDKAADQEFPPNGWLDDQFTIPKDTDEAQTDDLDVEEEQLGSADDEGETLSPKQKPHFIDPVTGTYPKRIRRGKTQVVVRVSESKE